ncbi:MAG: shikimate dehydrogenase [Planctomycetes bacterium]|nr:shikimate dehydrogenase [Planctomycetota bacterium]
MDSLQINKDTNVCISIAARPGNFGATFHNSAYHLLGLNWVYLPRKVETSSELQTTIEAVRVLGIKGCSVSMPHKEDVIQHLDHIDPSAEKIGAVNTIKLEDDGSLTGFNTDFHGAKKALEQVGIEGKQVVMIGAGGVAKAIGLAVIELGGELIIANRTAAKAQQLAERLNATAISLEQMNDTSGYLLINATSVGMRDPGSMVVSEQIIENFDIVKDAVIYPPETKLLKEALKTGKQVIPGTLMCVYQAAEQFKIYTGQDVPSEIISKTLETLTK